MTPLRSCLDQRRLNLEPGFEPIRLLPGIRQTALFGLKKFKSQRSDWPMFLNWILLSEKSNSQPRDNIWKLSISVKNRVYLGHIIFFSIFRSLYSLNSPVVVTPKKIRFKFFYKSVKNLTWVICEYIFYSFLNPNLWIYFLLVFKPKSVNIFSTRF